MNPSALEDLWTVVRLAAEGSDWKRDQGETLSAWAQRRLLRPEARVTLAQAFDAGVYAGHHYDGFSDIQRMKRQFLAEAGEELPQGGSE